MYSQCSWLLRWDGDYKILSGDGSYADVQPMYSQCSWLLRWDGDYKILNGDGSYVDVPANVPANTVGSYGGVEITKSSTEMALTLG
jgi:hypothetical protein